MDYAGFAPWLARWKLIPDGQPLITAGSQLLAVKCQADGSLAMLKLTHDESEQRGNALMAWWNGHGAAPVIAHEKEAILLARATGQASLSAMSGAGQDDNACRILSQVANRLHAIRKPHLPALIPLDAWFLPLIETAQRDTGMLACCAKTAEKLLSTSGESVPLHGDLHHDNVLDFGQSGWLAIDPKGLKGERGFDFANIFTNPDLGHPACQIATVPETFQRRLGIVCGISGIPEERLLAWIIAWCGLSAVWSRESNTDPSVQLRIATLALAALRG